MCMSWLLLAFIGTVCMAVANIIDKFLLEKRIKNPHVPVIMDGFLALIFPRESHYSILFLVYPFLILHYASLAVHSLRLF